MRIFIDARGQETTKVVFRVQVAAQDERVVGGSEIVRRVRSLISNQSSIAQKTTSAMVNFPILLCAVLAPSIAYAGVGGLKKRRTSGGKST